MMSYVWIFPVLFIFHDMEEIIGFIPWYQRNRKILEQKYPKISNVYSGTTTEGFAFAVYEELTLCIVICMISMFRNQYGIWLGALVACTVHFIIHIIQTLMLRQYIPALFTSMIGVPIGCFLIKKSIEILNYSILSLVIYSAIGAICILGNLRFAHMLMKKFSLWQSRQTIQ